MECLMIWVAILVVAPITVWVWMDNFRMLNK